MGSGRSSPGFRHDVHARYFPREVSHEPVGRDIACPFLCAPLTAGFVLLADFLPCGARLSSISAARCPTGDLVPAFAGGAWRAREICEPGPQTMKKTNKS